MDAIERARNYGVRMDEALDSAQIKELHAIKRELTVYWNHPDLARVTRLRLIGCSREYPRWDVSYCYGQLKDGTEVRVQLPFGQLKGHYRKSWMIDLIAYAKADNVFAKGLGLLDEDVVSRLYG